MFVSNTSRISGEFDSRKDSHSTKLEQRLLIFMKQVLENCVIESYLVYIILIISPLFFELKIGQNWKGRMQIHETPVLEVIFKTLTENSSVITRCQVTPRNLRNTHPLEMAVETHFRVQHDG